MRPFDYVRADDVDGALAAAGPRPDADYLGGGTNLVDRMRLGVARPGVLVDVSRLPAAIDETPDGGLRIAAAVRNSTVAADRRVREHYPVLAQAVLAGANGQIRNMATTGGNLLQRTRCVYFQDVSTPCNKREPGAGCSARGGHTRQHAIFGASEHCIATHPSDMAVGLAVLDPVVEVEGPAGVRLVPFADLHRLPGDEPDRDTTLSPGELITGLELPPLPTGARGTYRKVRDRTSFAFALVSVAAVIAVEDGGISEARIGLGGVAHAPWRARRAEDVLIGAPATIETFAAAAAAELEQARAEAGNAYKVPMLRSALVATLRDLTSEDR